MAGNDQVAVISDNWYDTRSERSYFFNPSNPAALRLVISIAVRHLRRDPEFALRLKHAINISVAL